MKHDKVIPYENSGDGKKSQVTQMFDNIAPYYDFLNRLLTLGIDQRWRKKAIHRLKNDAPNHILDIATGTADMPLQMIKWLDTPQITAVDISPKMIELAKEKVTKNKYDDRVQLSVQDSENLPFDEAQFDAATVSFGVRNFEDLRSGLKEISRVLKPNGKLVVLEFSKPTIFPFKQLFNSYFKYILPNIGKFTSKDPKAYQYLYESVQAFPDYDDFATVLGECGFQKVTWEAQTLGICTIYVGEK